MGDVVGHLMLQFERGRAQFRNGSPRPPQPSDEQQCTPAEAVWLGYMLERAAEMMRRWSVMDRLGIPRD